MKRLFVMALVIIQVIIHTYATDTYAEDTEEINDKFVYIVEGIAEGVNFTEGTFRNTIIGFGIDLTDKWSISAELEESLRIYPVEGSTYSLTPILRYKFFNSDIIEPYLLAGAGVLHQDMGSTFNNDRYGHHTDTEFMYHVVAGLGFEKSFNSFSVFSEARIEHESNGTDNKNDGFDKASCSFGIKYRF